MINRLAFDEALPLDFAAIWPEASSAQNSMAAVSAQGSGWVLIRRLNSSSIAFEVRIDFHWLGGKRMKVKSLSPLSPGCRRRRGI
jgi:hypothetical protein